MDTPQATKEVKEKMDTLLDKVDTVLDQQKELVKKQEVILEQVNTDEKEVQSEIEKVNSSFIVRTKSHKFLFPLIVTAGVVLVWRGLSGIFDATPLVNYSVVSLILGIAILWIFNNTKSS